MERGRGEGGRGGVLDCGLWVVGCGLWVVGCGLLGFGFWVVGFGFWVLGDKVGIEEEIDRSGREQGCSEMDGMGWDGKGN